MKTTIGFLMVFTVLFVSCNGDDNEEINSNPLKTPQAQTYKNVAAGDFHAVAIREDGTLWTWGKNMFGQIGPPELTGEILYYPGRQLGTDHNWIYVTASQWYSLAIKSDGTLWAWGSNDQGELGVGNYLYTPNPVQVGADSNWKWVEAGANATVGLKTDGTLWGWGNGLYCGFNTNFTYSSPVRIGTDADWKSIAVGMTHAVAIKENGTLWGWGSNAYGKLGDHDQSLNMGQIGTESDWKECFAGHDNSGAIKNNGTLWMWGSNSYGQIGVGYTSPLDNSFLPLTQVGTDNTWKKLSIGANSCNAIKADGTLWSWGANSEYVLGIPSPGTCTVPTQRGTGTDWQKVSIGYNCAYALKASNELWGCGMSNALGLTTSITPNLIRME